MIDILILYIISSREFTMYAIQKQIEKEFGHYTRPSFGALKPALKKLIFNEMITTREIMSDGGKLSIYYSITTRGQKELQRLLLENMSDNPLQFMTCARVKLSVAGVLNNEQKKEMFSSIKSQAQYILSSAESILNDEYTKKNFYERILTDNTICEYKNFITILEGFEKDNERNSK